MRKRPRQKRSRALVDAILEATRQLIERSDRFSTHAVAKRAGVSVGSLYQYFESRDGIYATLIERGVRQDADRVIEVLGSAQGEPLRKTMERTIGALADRYEPNADMLARLLIHGPRLGLVRAVDEQRSRVARALEPHLADHGVTLVDAPRVAEVLVGAVMGVFQAWVLRAREHRMPRAELEHSLVALAESFVRTSRGD